MTYSPTTPADTITVTELIAKHVAKGRGPALEAARKRLRKKSVSIELLRVEGDINDDDATRDDHGAAVPTARCSLVWPLLDKKPVLGSTCHQSDPENCGRTVRAEARAVRETRSLMMRVARLRGRQHDQVRLQTGICLATSLAYVFFSLASPYPVRLKL